jgi:anti-sigma regulatory factor (Ser/Thr protein kinase)
MHTARFVVPKEMSAIPPTRAVLTRTLRDLGVRDRVVAAAAVVGTELVTNAIRHGDAPIEVRVDIDDHHVARLAVSDGSAKQPGVRRVDDSGGRGLRLVGALSDSWGVDAEPPQGKTVWARLLAD